jgi:hypothetical protein
MMATCPVRFEFYCGEEELKYIHNVPRNLVTVGAQAAQKDVGYANLFVNTLQLIIKEHEAACLANSNAFCENCGSPRVTALQTPCLGFRMWRILLLLYGLIPYVGRANAKPRCDSKFKR